MSKKILPQTVIDEDHKLQEAEDNAGRALCKLRWHWTRDESNSERVSFADYAQCIGRTRALVRKYALAHEVLTAADARGTTLDPMSPSEAYFRASASADTEAATEAVAKARNVSFTHAHIQKQHRDEARAVREIARERADKKGTTIEEEAKKVARQRADFSKKEKQERERRNRDKPMSWLDADGSLAGVKRKLKHVGKLANDVEWTAEDCELLLHSVGEVQDILDMIRTVLTDDTEIDWDKELATITEDTE